MGDRRQFLKQVAAGLGGIFVGSASLASGATAAKIPGPPPAVQAGRHSTAELQAWENLRPGEYAWQSTLLCQVSDASILAVLGNEAINLPCKIFLADPQAPDLYAMPYFIAIVDRTSMSQESWGQFVEYRAEVEDRIPILLVDGLSSAEGWALDHGMKTVDVNSDLDLALMRREIKLAHARAQAWKPEYELEGA